MNRAETAQQQIINKYREIASKSLDEAARIRRELPDLPFLKQQSALKAIFDLESQAQVALEKAACLKTIS